MTKLTQAEMEAKYDAERDGSAYTKPADDSFGTDVTDELIATLEAIERHFDSLKDGSAEWIDAPPAAIQIERHILNMDGDPASDPWTTYTLGVAAIAIHDSGSGGNVCLSRGMLGFKDNAQLLDLALLLSNETVLEALDPSNNDTPPAAPAVRTSNWYHDPNQGGDLTEVPHGSLAWVDYECGEGISKARISFAAPSEPYTLSTRFAGEADLGLDVIEQAIANMQALLVDPRVQAARALARTAR